MLMNAPSPSRPCSYSRWGKLFGIRWAKLRSVPVRSRIPLALRNRHTNNGPSSLRPVPPYLALFETWEDSCPHFPRSRTTRDPGLPTSVNSIGHKQKSPLKPNRNPHSSPTEIPTQAQQTGLNGAPGTRIFSSAASLPNLRTIAAARTSSFYFTMNSAFSQELPGKCLPIISNF